MRLTKRVIDTAEYEGKQYESGNWQRCVLWADNPPGFGLRITHAGTKSFILKYRNESGKTRQMTLGKYGVLTLKQAREVAREKLVEVSKGDDPLAEREQRKNAETVADLVDTFIEKYSKPRKKTWKSDKSRLEVVTDAWGDRNPEDITHSDVDELHRSLMDTPYRANRTLENIQTMFNFAANEGFLPREKPNPAANVQKFHEKSRDRWIHEDEMPALLDAIDKESSPYMRGVFWMLLLTGARRSEVLGATWKHINLDRAEWFIPETKNGESHTVPLNDPAVRMLEDIPRKSSNPYVFCGHVEGQALVNIDKAWNRICERAELEDVRIHDLRRTVAAWLATAGYSELVIKKLLNHSVQGVTGIYARVGPKAVRRAVEEYGKQLMADRNENGEVIPLATARGQR